MSDLDFKELLKKSISPTRMQTYGQCNRKWFFDCIMDLKMPATASMERGTAVHKSLELYYKEGKYPDEDLKLQRVLEYTPEPGPNVHSEYWISLGIEGYPDIGGTIDLLDLRDPSHPIIFDYKTMKTFNYALNEHQLENNIQLLCYAHAVIEQLAPQAKCVTVTHIQIALDISALPRKASVTIETIDIHRKWSEITTRFIEPMKIDATKTAFEVRANFGPACNAYKRPCHHTARCASVELKGQRETEMGKMSDKQINDVDFDVDVLYVDCMPMDSNASLSHFSDIINELAVELQAETDVPDWRLHEYGKGKGLLANKLRRATLPREIFVSTREDLSALALEIIAPRAAQVIMGVK